MNILVLDDYQRGISDLPSFGKLRDHQVTVLDRPLDQVANVDDLLASTEAVILLRERSRVDAALLARMPRLRYISQTGKVGKHVDVDACSKRGVLIAEGAGTAYAAAELAFLLTMSAMRNLVQEIDGMKAGRFGISLGRTLKGRTLGILGYGKVGVLMARFASAFGMTVVVHGSDASMARATVDGHGGIADRARFFATCDAVSIHLRLAPATRGSVREDDLMHMKPDAVLVNTARAEIVDQRGLENALRAGRPRVAAVDVYMQEPPSPVSDPIIALPNVIATPHIGYLDVDSFEIMMASAIDNLLAVVAGDRASVVGNA
ncbi:MAG: D-2-hydroxyacid dehydrogenase family protein [Casimicrobiaceae bacterium]